MDWHWINFDIDGSVAAQESLRALFEETVDLRSCQDILRLYANRKGQRTLREKIVELRSRLPGRWVSFIGSGDYHHVTAILLETLPDELKPVHLVLVDNHPDWFDMPLRYHCGTWVATALRLPYLESATLIGMTSDDLKGHEFWFSPFKHLCDGRLTMHPYHLESVHVPLKWPSGVKGAASSTLTKTGVQINFDTVSKLGIDGMCQRLSKNLGGKNVILSIDKDCLSPEFATTDWEQGKLTANDLVKFIETLAANTNLVGIDICGEKAPQPLKGTWKRYDAGRLNSSELPDWDSVNLVNEKTNVILMNALKSELKT